jgi:pyrimidine-nucleoside phosphorylase
MRILDLISKKKAGEALTRAEIEDFIKAYTAGELPDYQVAALLMAICWQGLNIEETAWLTLAMADSGERLDFSQLSGIKVDKHSTGGVGDTTSLIVAPLVAALGLKVPKMSGRGLGHTGGTIDKLESIPGLSCDLPREQFFQQVEEIGLAIAGQTANLAPADKKLYALRDVTGTVDSPALIAASILSKKIAGGAEHIVLDVKSGSGAFMKDFSAAQHLAQLMVEIGREAGLAVHAVVSSMEQPLGRAVGNRIEVYEALQVLKGEGPEDLRECSLAVAKEMLAFRGGEPDQAELQTALVGGSALEKFYELVEAQGGDRKFLEQQDQLWPTAQGATEESFTAQRSGYICQMDTDKIGEAARILGAGRSRLDEQLDLDAGFYFDKKLGDKVTAGETICRIFSHEKASFAPCRELLTEAIHLSENPPKVPPLILATLGR